MAAAALAAISSEVCSIPIVNTVSSTRGFTRKYPRRSALWTSPRGPTARNRSHCVRRRRHKLLQHWPIDVVLEAVRCLSNLGQEALCRFSEIVHAECLAPGPMAPFRSSSTTTDSGAVSRFCRRYETAGSLASVLYERQSSRAKLSLKCIHERRHTVNQRIDAGQPRLSLILRENAFTISLGDLGCIERHTDAADVGFVSLPVCTVRSMVASAMYGKGKVGQPETVCRVGS